jgi:hypothetical protein
MPSSGAESTPWRCVSPAGPCRPGMWRPSARASEPSLRCCFPRLKANGGDHRIVGLLDCLQAPLRGGPTPPSPPGRLPPTVSLHRGGRGAQPQVWTAPPTQRRGRTPPRWPLCRRREGLKHAAKNVHVLLRHRPPSIPRSQRRPGVAPDVARFGHRLRLALWRSSSASASCRLAASR